ncbi:MAG: histidine kinase, partial [Leptospiraceae bacterium]|nr:histidine kinase [Leptospiraceae bacterium]
MNEKVEEAIKKKLRATILSKDKISVKSSKINAKLENYVLAIVKEILEKHGQTQYTDMLYTILKELAINAIKANQKRIFFEEHGLNIMDQDD